MIKIVTETPEETLLHTSLEHHVLSTRHLPTVLSTNMINFTTRNSSNVKNIFVSNRYIISPIYSILGWPYPASHYWYLYFNTCFCFTEYNNFYWHQRASARSAVVCNPELQLSSSPQIRYSYEHARTRDSRSLCKRWHHSHALSWEMFTIYIYSILPYSKRLAFAFLRLIFMLFLCLLLVLQAGIVPLLNMDQPQILWAMMFTLYVNISLCLRIFLSDFMWKQRFLISFPFCCI